MNYEYVAIPETNIPRATSAQHQYLIDTYTSESNKVVSVWTSFANADLNWRPHPKSSSIEEILQHQLLSERRFFGEFLGTPEPTPAEILPKQRGVKDYHTRFIELVRPRLDFFARQSDDWWFGKVPFFDVTRERIWVFWRRVLHTAHHRTQLTVYLRLMDEAVPSTYGPTADVTWKGADPTNTVDAAGRR